MRKVHSKVRKRYLARSCLCAMDVARRKQECSFQTPAAVLLPPFFQYSQDRMASKFQLLRLKMKHNKTSPGDEVCQLRWQLRVGSSAKLAGLSMDWNTLHIVTVVVIYRSEGPIKETCAHAFTVSESNTGALANSKRWENNKVEFAALNVVRQENSQATVPQNTYISI